MLALHLPAVDIFRRLIENSGTRSVIDLCSGGGGPIPALREALSRQGMYFDVTLTDKFPNSQAVQLFSSNPQTNIRYLPCAVDAMKVPNNLIGLRTMFNAFHHFGPESARSVFESAVQSQQPIGIFELTEPSVRMKVLALFIPLAVVLCTPFIKPFRWERLLWTYLIPLIPLTCFWDGFVSACRAYSAEELIRMTEGLDDFEWEVDSVPLLGLPGRLTYVMGIPPQPSCLD